MCCSLNGVPACLNKKLLIDILRTEWGFTGYVVSDDDALIFAVSQHHYVPTAVDAAADSIKAGCNLELTDAGSGWIYSYLQQVISLYCMHLL